MSQAPFNPNMDEMILTDAELMTANWSQIAKYSVTPTVINDGSVMAFTSLLGGVTQTITAGLTNPDVVRNVSIKGNTAGITGNVVVHGMDGNNVAISDSIALNGVTTVVGVKPFATVTSVDLPVAIHTPVLQIETATVVGTITAGGFATVVVTAAGMTGTPKTFSVAVIGTEQKETMTVVGTIDVGGAGNATVITTAAGMTGSPISTTVAVANNDTASQVATKVQTALALNANINAWFTIGGTGADVVLTRKAASANDATMNMAITNDTCTGLIPEPTSANTLAGVAGDTATLVAGKIITALGNDVAVSALFNVSGSGANVVLTRKVAAADDATLNVATDNGTCAGLTTEASSVNTLAGVIIDKVEIGVGNVLGFPFLMSRNTVLFTFQGSVVEAVPPTLVMDATNLYGNKFTLATALNGTEVDIIFIVPE